MPASSTETRNRWRKRKREPQIGRKPKPQDDDEEEDEDEDDVDLHPQQQQAEFDDEQLHGPSTSSDPAPIRRESEVLADGGDRICHFPPVVKHTVNRPHSSVLSIVSAERAVLCGESKGQQQQGSAVLENLSYGQLQVLSTVPVDSPALGLADPESSSYVISPPTILEGQGVVKRFGGNRVHVVPMHADWFSPYTVHRLERQVIPHFFSGKSVDHTPEKYMECRNCIVAKYMDNPDKRVSVVDCQGFAVGVATDDLTRIVRFLDHWGIINYCAAAPLLSSQNDGLRLGEDSNGDLRVPAAALKSFDSLVQFDKPRSRLKAVDVYPEMCGLDDENSDLDNRIVERLSESRCNFCSEALPVIYYQSQKEVDVQLCSNCFHEGRFIIGHSSLDFIKVDSAKDYDLDGETWTDQETLRLLEAMELYRDNWNAIAEHVVTKSKSQCILQFVRLPLNDSQLENVELRNASSSKVPKKNGNERAYSNSNGEISERSIQNADFESSFPFENSENPIMYLVAFLTAAMGPRVAAACAHASLAALSKDGSFAVSGNTLQLDGSGSGNRSMSESMHGRDSGYGDMSSSSQQIDGAPLPGEKLTAAKVGLAAAATKSKLFADHEEREIQRLCANIVNQQLKRLELKLKQFAEIENLLMRECEQLERARQRITSERALMISAQFGPAGGAPPPPPPMGGVPGMVNNPTGNTRQQVAAPGSSSSLQPFIHGYGNNQQIHPHMSLAPQQPVYGPGPRLPLSSIQASSSTSPNAMLNAGGANSPSGVSHSMLRPVSGTKSGLG